MRRDATAPSTANPDRLVEHQKEQRKSRRFALQQPAVVRRHDDISTPLDAQTENASLHGVLLHAPGAIPDASQVEVELRLCKEGMQGILLRAAGRVVRSEVKRLGEFGIAIAFDQPLSEGSAPRGQTARPKSRL